MQKDTTKSMTFYKPIKVNQNFAEGRGGVMVKANNEQ